MLLSVESVESSSSAEIVDATFSDVVVEDAKTDQ